MVVLEGGRFLMSKVPLYRLDEKAHGCSTHNKTSEVDILSARALYRIPLWRTDPPTERKCEAAILVAAKMYVF